MAMVLLIWAGVLFMFNLEAARAQDLSALARDMYIFTFPLHENYRVRYAAHFATANPWRVPINQFLHRRELADHTSRAVTTPNNDTLYSSAFLDLSGGPLVLDVPEIADRYYSLAFMDFYGNNFAYVGTRATGSKAGKYLITGPGWKGVAPAPMQAIASPTNAVWLLARILVVNSADLPRGHAVQDMLRLSLASDGAAVAPFDGPPMAPGDPWNYFAVINHALAQNPAPAGEAAYVRQFQAIGVGPGLRFDPTRFDETQQKALLEGVAEAKRLIAAKDVSDRVVNGWSYSGAKLGNPGTDYLFRAATALKLLAALDPVEAIYISYVGERLDGNRNYRLRFEPGRLPPVAGFWSLSLYEVMPDKRMFFAANALNRYAIGDRTPGLRTNQDGSLEIYIQSGSPGSARENNWLPAPTAEFALVLRAYLPKPALMDGTYRLPAIEALP